MAYNQFASIYDELMKDAPYEAWVALTNHILKDKGMDTTVSVLDLGCGTGEIALRLSKYGYELVGVDYSSEMLSVAQHKAMDAGEQIRWVCQDMRELEGFMGVDVVISYCDVMNYILDEADIVAVFDRVSQSLTDDGLFIFDVHDDIYATNSLLGHTFADVGDDITYIWECEEGDREGRLVHDLSFFQKKGTDTYVKFSETHEQQVYPLSFYEKLLKKAGFRKIEFLNDFQLENGLSSENRVRNFIIAEK